VITVDGQDEQVGGALEPGYPPYWEADVVLSDGGTVHLRPIRPDDADGLVTFFHRWSAETVYRRFFTVRSELTPTEVTRFVTVDYLDRVAIMAELGGQMVAVARYDRLPGTDEAEVAFVVEDAHQGRGIGSVLLEHLAAAARERGIRSFLAEVLPGNRRMVGVFTDAGYVARREYGDGVVRLSFPIEPTDLSESVMRAREHRAEARSVERLLVPRSVAVVGASRERGSIGRRLLDNLLVGEFTGEVYAVNAAGGEIGGRTAYLRVSDIPGDVDLALVATPASTVLDVVEDCARKGVKGLVIVSSGFAEVGAEGLALQREVVAAARANGMRVVGPNCLGVINTDPEIRLNATLAPASPGRGRVGFFCHAGALGIAILEEVEVRGLGLSTFVSAGNRADVSGNDMLQLWQEDPETDVVLLYLESFGNPRKFGRIARRVARLKPVVAVKGARSLAGPPAWLAGSGVRTNDTAVDELFRQSGVIRVDTLTALFDTAVLLAHQPLPVGRNVAVVGNSAALALLAADACQASGLDVTTSVDVGAEGSPEQFREALATTLARADVDAVVTVFVPGLSQPEPDLAGVLADVTFDATKPVVSTFYGFLGVAAPGSVPSYRSPEAGVQALARAVEYAEWRARPSGEVPDFDVDGARAHAVLEAALAEDDAGGTLSPSRTVELLAAYGITVLPTRLVDTAAGAVAAADEVGYPVALKSTVAHLRHRTDLGSVQLDLPDAGSVAAAFAAVAMLGERTVAVQPMAAGVATVVGLSDDSSFGPLVSFGLAGVATDLLGDVGYRSLPLTDVDAADLVRSVRAAPLLFGHRGDDHVDVDALEDLLLRLGLLADRHPELIGVELDPVLVGTSGISVLSATVRVAPPSPSWADEARRLG
jgi:acyl-CoA synthetase (NDP forming)/GNAT superfamily N-acetyltransferase